MNTRAIKTFAIEARRNLMQAVKAKLNHWGFDEQGNVLEEPAITYGGYTFRGNVYSNEKEYTQWQKLKARIHNKEDVEKVVEEAAYTWFNRLIAIKILEKNAYIAPVLEFAEATRTPMVVQNAKQGMHDLKDEKDKQQLLEYLSENEETKAFNLLITRFCNRSSLFYHVFGKIDDYTELLIPSNLIMQGGFLDKLNNAEAITDEDYKEVELIGWLYQFYVSERKDEVFKGFKQKKKARPEDIPAATEIFTPKWIVRYMVENTLGKLYLALEPDSGLKDNMKYLVENPADAEEEPIIEDVTELSLLDPASGSGHILVVGFELLMQMYREAGYNARQAVRSILKNNLFGLDIDLRAVQLSRFALLLKAAEYDPEILKFSFKGGPEGILPHVYTFPEKTNIGSDSIEAFLGKEGYEYITELRENINLLQEGKNIGSALQLDLSEKARKHILEQAKYFIQQPDIHWEELKGFIEPLLVMSMEYTAVVTNPPYMGQKNMNGRLKTYINDNYPISKSDLFAVFMEVTLNHTCRQGLMGMINQHSWMFLSSYEKLREEVLKYYTIDGMLHLGPRTFEELSGEVVQSTAFVLKNNHNNEAKANYHRLVDYKTNKEKEQAFLNGTNYFPKIPQTNFAKIPGSPIAYWVSDVFISLFENEALEAISKPRQGMATSNNDKFLKYWFEVSTKKIGIRKTKKQAANSNLKWFPYNKGGTRRKWYGNNLLTVNWKNDGEEILQYAERLYKSATRTIKNIKFYFKEGLTFSLTNTSGFSARYVERGFLFDVQGSSLFFDDDRHRYNVLALLNSKLTDNLLSIINPSMVTQVADIKKIPFIYPDKIADVINTITSNLVYVSKLDWDSLESSWDFTNFSLVQYNTNIESAYQNWLDKAKENFLQLHKNEEELNRIFIDIYGLQEELTPEVPFKEITILQDEIDPSKLDEFEQEYRETGVLKELPIKQEVVMAQLMSYAIGCMLGRYSLDKPGLIMANQGELLHQALEKHGIKEERFPIDEDGIISLNGTDSPFADDASRRLRAFLEAVWGEDNLTANINFLNRALCMDYEKWLLEKFWSFHCRMYKKTPIYWLFASNPKYPHNAAFKVLVYMHRMNKFSIQTIRNQYLLPFIKWLREEIAKLEANEDNLDRQEMKRLTILRKDELECVQYDDTLKKLGQIEFDLDDGVKKNIAKFEGSVAEIK